MALTRVFAKYLSNYESETSFGAKLRAKRIVPLLDMIKCIYQQNGSVNIVDLGGTETYWRIVSREFLRDLNVSITIVNLPGSAIPQDHDIFRFIEGDACNLSQFRNEQFDIAHSNSVVEHVGDWGCMVAFSEELRRVSKHYFCQTPNYWFPIEPHCMTPLFHWLPKPIRVWLVLHFQLGHWRKADSMHEAVRIVESARLLNRKMFQALFPDATIMTERWFLLPKSLVAVRTNSTSLE